MRTIFQRLRHWLWPARAYPTFGWSLRPVEIDSWQPVPSSLPGIPAYGVVRLRAWELRNGRRVLVVPLQPQRGLWRGPFSLG